MSPQRLALFLVALSFVTADRTLGQSTPTAPHAAPIGAAITVRSGDPCLDPAAIALHVARWLHRDTIDARLGVLLRPAPEGSGELLEIVRDGEVVAERTFDAGRASCAERQAALGLMIALALDATVVETLDVPPPPEPDDAPPTPPLPPPAPARVYAFGLDGVVWLGVLPRASVGAALWGEVSWRARFALRLGVLGNATSSASLERGRVSSGFIAGRLDACAGGASSSFRFEGCAGLMTGGVLARGRGFSSDARTLGPFGAIVLGAGGHVTVSRTLAIRVALEAAVPFVRTELAITDVEGTTVARLEPAPAAASISFGIVRAFR